MYSKISTISICCANLHNPGRNRVNLGLSTGANCNFSYRTNRPLRACWSFHTVNGHLHFHYTAPPWSESPSHCCGANLDKDDQEEVQVWRSCWKLRESSSKKGRRDHTVLIGDHTMLYCYMCVCVWTYRRSHYFAPHCWSTNAICSAILELWRLYCNVNCIIVNLWRSHCTALYMWNFHIVEAETWRFGYVDLCSSHTAESKCATYCVEVDEPDMEISHCWLYTAIYVYTRVLHTAILDIKLCIHITTCTAYVDFLETRRERMTMTWGWMRHGDHTGLSTQLGDSHWTLRNPRQTIRTEQGDKPCPE